MGRAGALLAKKLYSCLAGDKERGGCLRGMAAARSRKTHKTVVCRLHLKLAISSYPSKVSLRRGIAFLDLIFI